MRLSALVASVCVFVVSLIVSMNAQARSLEDIKKSGKIVAATEGQFPPFNFFKNGVLSGFEVDLAKEIAKKMGLAIEWKNLPFDSLLIGLSQNRYDFVIASHGITAERSKAVLFTKPHYCTGGVIVGKEQEVAKAKLKDLKVGVQVGTSYMTALQTEHLYKDLKTFPKDTDALQSLLSGKVDAWVSDRFVAIEAAKSRAELKVGHLIFVEQVGMAVAPGNTALANALSGALADLRASGTYANLSREYFKADVGCAK